MLALAREPVRVVIPVTRQVTGAGGHLEAPAVLAGAKGPVATADAA